MIIAIDGPSASGKSSTALAVARALGFAHLDSGALYRGVTLVALQELGFPSPVAGLTPEQIQTVLDAADRLDLQLVRAGEGYSVQLRGKSVDRPIRSAEVTASVSAVSAVAAIREWVNRRLRSLSRGGQSLVVDGRDIGTVVFPYAELKVFLTASPEIRARRRLLQIGESVEPERVAKEAERLAVRDEADRTRPVAPLRPAIDAILLDGSDLSLEGQVQRIVDLAHKRHG
ncbi:MAG TPA: (d)CMP kinase [Gemmatimonadales bacterium]|jgi:cytidylate kinase|nr:(d)CMP kinase [Gemmatimonadales bacterium]